MELLKKLPEGVPITLTGDLIDRGMDSNKVIQYVMDNDNIDSVKGNHEVLMDDFFTTYAKLLDGETVELRDEDLFLVNGGFQTIRSYGFTVKQTGFYAWIITPPEDLTEIKAHLEFIRSLPLTIEYPECVNSEGRKLIVSHSSVNHVYVWDDEKKKQYKNAYEQNILWGRPSTIKDVPEIYNIFGHTPQEFEPRIRVPFANVDTGCCYQDVGRIGSDKPSYSKLTGLQYPEMVVFSQENVE